MFYCSEMYETFQLSVKFQHQLTKSKQFIFNVYSSAELQNSVSDFLFFVCKAILISHNDTVIFHN